METVSIQPMVDIQRASIFPLNILNAAPKEHQRLALLLILNEIITCLLRMTRKRADIFLIRGAKALRQIGMRRDIGLLIFEGRTLIIQTNRIS